MTLFTVPPSKIQRLTDASEIDRMSDRQLEEWIPAFVPRWNAQYMPHKPTQKQRAALLFDNREMLFGGAAGGGKSDYLLMAALQYVDRPGYAALLLRRTYADLEKPGALIPRSHEWLDSTDAHWNGYDRQWRFPSGAVLDFGYLDGDDDLRKYQSAQYQFIGFDELTHFEEKWYRYLFSRLRRLKEQAAIPARMRSASNPGGIGHEWVKQRFLIEGPSHGRIFLKSTLDDNPYLDTEEYEQSLAELDPVTQAQLRHGDWETREPGEFFNKHWFHIVDEEEVPPNIRWVRSWDLAATKSKTAAYTAGVKMAVSDGKVYFSHVARQRGDPGETEQLVKHTAEVDGKGVSIWIEQEGGSGGVNTMWRYQRTVLFGYAVQPFHPRMDKLTRARPLSATARFGGCYLVRRKGADNSWINTFLDEANAFPNGFKDQVDSATQGFSALTMTPEPRVRSL